MKSAFEYDFNTCVKGIPHYVHFQQSIAEMIYSFAKCNKKPITILDIGCGTGNILKYLDLLSFKYSYVGVDSNSTLLKVASSQYVGSEHQFIKVDALAFLNSTESNFDIVLNSWTFHNWDTIYRSKVLQVLYTRLANGGLFLNSDKIAVNNINHHNQNYIWQIEAINSIFFDRLDIIQEWTEHYLLDESPNKKVVEDEYISQLELVGFTEIKLTNRTYMDVIITCKK